MPDRIAFDYGSMLASRIGERGIDDATLDRTAGPFGDIHDSVERHRLAGDLAFFDLPEEADTVREIRTFAEGVGQAFDTVVVLGIGGSALGASALQQALLAPFW
ncbi:MAG: glucose-6-phosphate isomerase, partial [Longimicrobiales bacterium]